MRIKNSRVPKWQHSRAIEHRAAFSMCAGTELVLAIFRTGIAQAASLFDEPIGDVLRGDQLPWKMRIDGAGKHHKAFVQL